ncbi:QacE family quaternary ammonium compound efflux SMR transporter [Halobacteriales archaeon QH_10_67_13]|nr:MAG: QacE family quaternary ammonium compound efflux SMR transporter [Halobacteriales archaeon QH_10_67_13]
MSDAYLFLAGAILTEVTGTTLLKLSEGFDQASFGAAAVGLYLVSFYCVSEALVELPVGLVYATWSAAGILALAAIGIAFFGEPIDAAGVLGIILVVLGIVVLNVYSGAYAPA